MTNLKRPFAPTHTFPRVTGHTNRSKHMNIEILQNGQVLRRYTHNGRDFIEAPPEGDYQIRLTNTASRRRMAVVSVDGINVVDGSAASHDGPGYVLSAWESVTIKGWRRTDSKVAAFNFRPQEGSLAAQTGRGTKNTGVIGIAVFDEKEKPQPQIIPPIVIHEHHYHKQEHWLNPSPFRYTTNDNTRILSSQPIGTACATASAPTPGEMNEELSHSVTCGMGTGRSSQAQRRITKSVQNKNSVDLGTGYGQEVTMYTQTTEFERATTSPVFVAVLHYGTREKLIEWGVPVTTSPTANPFPASTGPMVAPPPGWRG